jgi:hypothetical protein
LVKRAKQITIGTDAGDDAWPGGDEEVPDRTSRGAAVKGAALRVAAGVWRWRNSHGYF